MRMTTRRKDLKRQIEKNKFKFEQLIGFLVNHKGVNERYQVNMLQKSLAGFDNSEDKIRYIILDCMNSSSQPNLTNIGETMEELNEDGSLINRIIEGKVGSYESAFKELDDMDGIGKKIAALILRNIHYAFKYDLLKVNKSKWAIEESSLKIAIDVVICEAINKCVLLPESSKPRFEANNDFDFLNDILKAYLPEGKNLVLFEDLWFWVYFNQTVLTKETKEKVRIHCKLNTAKVHAEKWINPKELLHILEEPSIKFRAILTNNN